MAWWLSDRQLLYNIVLCYIISTKGRRCKVNENEASSRGSRRQQKNLCKVFSLFLFFPTFHFFAGRKLNFRSGRHAIPLTRWEILLFNNKSRFFLLYCLVSPFLDVLILSIFYFIFEKKINYIIFFSEDRSIFTHIIITNSISRTNDISFTHFYGALQNGNGRPFFLLFNFGAHFVWVHLTEFAHIGDERGKPIHLNLELVDVVTFFPLFFTRYLSFTTTLVGNIASICCFIFYFFRLPQWIAVYTKVRHRAGRISKYSLPGMMQQEKKKNQWFLWSAHCGIIQ